jgi:putative ABC transport system substrate-binding protein
MRRRQAVAGLLALGALTGSSLARAQTGGPPRRIARLTWSNPDADTRDRTQFLEDLAQLGWIDGRNMVHTTLYAEGDLARIDSLAAEAVALKPDLIVASSIPRGALALQRATTTIPIVFVVVADPVGLGLVSSLTHPGKNITGVAASFDHEIIGKHFQLLKEWLPRLSRVAVMRSPLTSANMAYFADLRRYATEFGLQLQELTLRDAADIDPVFAELQHTRPDVAFISGNVVTLTQRDTIVGRLTTMRIPATSNHVTIIDAGCLYGYTTLARDYSREAARFVDRILRGAKPSELPVTQVSRYELVINVKVAKALGLAVPKSLLVRADRVIE